MQKRLTFRRTSFSGQGSSVYLQGALALLLCLSLLSLSSCGATTPIQQEAAQQRTTLQQTLLHAQAIGIPQAPLQPIKRQKQVLDQTKAPLSLFNSQATTEYFQNLTTRYRQLTLQIRAIEQVTTERLKGQAQTNLLALQNTLAQGRVSHLPVDTLAQVYTQESAKFKGASTPGEFSAISIQAKAANDTLAMLPHTLDMLKTFNDALGLLKDQHQDVSAQQSQYSDDNTAISQAVTPGALQKIEQQIDTQNQQLVTQYQSLIPDLVSSRIQQFDTSVKQIQQAGLNASTYQSTLTADKTQGNKVQTMADFLTFSKKVTADMALMQNDLLKAQTILLVKQFHKEVDDWGNAHLYHDSYNGQDYPLDNSYMAKGIGEDLDRDLANAVTLSDYQDVTATTQNELFHLHMLEQDYTDKTSYNQMHQTDIQLLKHYQLMQGQVIIVSTTEQALRVYENGKLVQGFLVTAGRPELPTVPGLWSPLWRLTKTTFHSPYPPGSPYYYEPTKINYAIMYHDGGYFLHDSWWRNDYGPGTQFYHIDSSGNVSASYGTHGCVNIREDQAAWLYNRTSYNTSILIY